MTIEEFGKSVKTKYPQYASYSDAELGQRMVEKYPVYQSQISPPEEQEGFLSKAAKLTDTLFGGGKIGEKIGTLAVKSGFTGLSKEQRQELERSGQLDGPSGRELVGDALGAASLFTPVGRIAKGVTTAARTAGLSKGANALGKVTAGATAGLSFDVGSDLKEGRNVAPGLGTTLGAAIPAAGIAKNVAVRFGQDQAPRIVNSLIKPLAKDFSYGKNPGRAVAEEKIVANNFDDLVEGISQRRQEVGQQIGDLGQQLSGSQELKVSQSLSVLDDAMRTAARQNNSTLLQRLQKTKEAITTKLEPALDNDGNIGIKKGDLRKLDNLSFSEVRDILREIGDMTQFTGNPSDDKLVNSTLKSLYGKIKQVSLDAARKENPELAKKFEELTERYADLTSAEIAAKYRDKIAERQNLIGVSPALSGVASAVIAFVVSGGTALPAILAGVGGIALDKLASTPGFKTRLAAILSKKSPQEVKTIFDKVPALRTLFPKGGAVSPGDRLLDTKAGKSLENSARDVSLGLSIKPVKITKHDLSLMSDFTDYFAGSYRPKGGEATRLEATATRLWEKYLPNRKLPRDLQGFSDQFGRILERSSFKR